MTKGSGLVEGKWTYEMTRDFGRGKEVGRREKRRLRSEGSEGDFRKKHVTFAAVRKSKDERRKG
jgi:hypothetical protein